MIQLNLLPDIKQEYIRAQKMRRLITAIATVVALAAIALVVILFLSVDVVQKKQLSSAASDITTNSNKVKSIPDIDKILTVQNQLDSLTSLHDEKPAASRLFNYMEQTTPINADINNLTIDFTQQTLTITGTADTLTTVNEFVDTLKTTKYTVNDAADQQNPAFSNVVLSSFGTQNGRASYTVTLNYDPPIFDTTQKVKIIPSPNTDSSQLNSNPDTLFKTAPKTGQKAGGQ